MPTGELAASLLYVYLHRRKVCSGKIVEGEKKKKKKRKIPHFWISVRHLFEACLTRNGRHGRHDSVWKKRIHRTDGRPRGSSPFLPVNFIIHFAVGCRERRGRKKPEELSSLDPENELLLLLFQAMQHIFETPSTLNFIPFGRSFSNSPSEIPSIHPSYRVAGTAGWLLRW